MGWMRQEEGENRKPDNSKLQKFLKDICLVALGMAVDFALTHYTEVDLKAILYRPAQQNLIAGAFFDKENATELCAHIVAHGINATILTAKSGESPMYIVSVKASGSKDMDDIIKKLQKISIFVESVDV